MDLQRADDALTLMVDVLVSRPGSVKERLLAAWAEHGGELRAEDLPDANYDDFLAIRDALADPAGLSEEDAAEFASAVAVLRAEVALAYGRETEREHPSPRVHKGT